MAEWLNKTFGLLDREVAGSKSGSGSNILSPPPPLLSGLSHIVLWMR